jgi:hypothetical protein
MGPTTPAPALTRAAARSRSVATNPVPTRDRTPVFVDKSGRRVRMVRAFALAGVAIVVAYIGLVIASLVGVPSIVSPLLPQPAAQVAVTTPTPSAVRPTPVPSPTADASPTDDAEETASTTSPGPASPAPAPSPAPSETTPPTNGSSETERGKSAAAPGQTKAPTPPTRP